jgi:hypothetical protein
MECSSTAEAAYRQRSARLAGMPRRIGSSKYTPLTDYLAALTADEARLTLTEIEAIIGVPLPAWAHQASFWSNGLPGVFRLQPWVRAGWRMARTEMHSAPPAVHFVRVSGSTASPVASHCRSPAANA